MSIVSTSSKAGIAEALRHAQGVVNRDIQFGVLIAAADRADRTAAGQVPDSPDAEEPRGEADEQHDRGEHREREHQPERDEPGYLVDLEA